MKDNKEIRVVLGGYYGFGNLGDEAILSEICRWLLKSSPNIKITVLSKKPKETRRFGVASVHRMNFFAIAWKMLISDAYISGGGGLLQNRTSRRSLWYYSVLMLMGQIFCKNLFVYANGVGELYGRCRLLKFALKRARFISTRGEASKRRLEAIGISGPKIIVCADPTLASTVDATAKEKLFLISLREGGKLVNTDGIISFCCHKKEQGLMPVFVATEPCDIEICRCMAEKCKGKAVYPESFQALLGLMSGAQFALGMRLHFLYSALLCEVPFVCLYHDAKTKDIADEIGSGAAVSCMGFDARELNVALKIADAFDGEKVREELAKSAEQGLSALCAQVLQTGAKFQRSEKRVGGKGKRKGNFLPSGRKSI